MDDFGGSPIIPFPYDLGNLIWLSPHVSPVVNPGTEKLIPGKVSILTTFPSYIYIINQDNAYSWPTLDPAKNGPNS